MSFFLNQCLTQVAWAKFGIIDDNNLPGQPAFITNADPETWDVIVGNSSGKNLDFYAIDCCIRFYKEEDAAQLESSCDAAIVDQSTVYFIEIKKRESSGWLTKAINQITNTITLYRTHHPDAPQSTIVGHVCNTLKPHAQMSYMGVIKQFRNDTGCKLVIKQELDID